MATRRIRVMSGALKPYRIYLFRIRISFAGGNLMRAKALMCLIGPAMGIMARALAAHSGWPATTVALWTLMELLITLILVIRQICHPAMLSAACAGGAGLILLLGAGPGLRHTVLAGPPRVTLCASAGTLIPSWV